MATTSAKAGAAGPFYVTTRVLGTGTTSTATMQIWQLLTEHLIRTGKAMSQAELAEKAQLTPEEIEAIFSQEYYQKHYGFRRFESEEEFEQWAKDEGVLYDPEKHAPAPEEAAAEAGGDPQDEAQA